MFSADQVVSVIKDAEKGGADARTSRRRIASLISRASAGWGSSVIKSASEPADPAALKFLEHEECGEADVAEGEAREGRIARLVDAVERDVAQRAERALGVGIGVGRVEVEREDPKDGLGLGARELASAASCQ